MRKAEVKVATPLPLSRPDSAPAASVSIPYSSYSCNPRRSGLVHVWLNMCWMYVITMEGSRRALGEWIDLVPGHRLLGFGSDVHFPELVYGHLLMARSCLADVLAEKVDRDFLSERCAIDLARKMMHDNAVELYRLDESGPGT